MLSTTHNFLFVHVPKTAGNSIQRNLVRFSTDSIVKKAAHHDGLEMFEIESPNLNVHKHSTALEYRKQISGSDFDALHKACGVRNPWDRCISHYFSPYRGEVAWDACDFKNFVNKNVKPLKHYIQLSDGDRHYFSNIDSFIRFENLQSDFQKFCQRVNISDTQIEHRNQSSRAHYREYYESNELIDFVAEKFAEEIEYFRYSF